jgi:hypothetical protein
MKQFNIGDIVVWEYGYYRVHAIVVSDSKVLIINDNYPILSDRYDIGEFLSLNSFNYADACKRLSKEDICHE